MLNNIGCCTVLFWLLSHTAECCKMGTWLSSLDFVQWSVICVLFVHIMCGQCVLCFLTHWHVRILHIGLSVLFISTPCMHCSAGIMFNSESSWDLGAHEAVECVLCFMCCRPLAHSCFAWWFIGWSFQLLASNVLSHLTVLTVESSWDLHTRTIASPS